MFEESRKACEEFRKVFENSQKCSRNNKMRRVLTPILLHVQYRLSLLRRMQNAIFSFLENFIFALLILVSEFFIHFGALSLSLKCTTFVNSLKHNMVSAKTNLCEFLKNENFPDWRRNGYSLRER